MRRLRFPEFPNSYLDPFIETSPETPSYNCIAWAFGDDEKWYWPDPLDIYYWPNNVPREITTTAFIELYSSIGYIICENGLYEENIEKIAIFTDSIGKPTHAARQLVDGSWTSKLGQSHDISHSIESMNNSFYGNATIFMSRNR